MKNPKQVRETITRRQQGFRVKFPSFKMGLMIRCESLLERDAARYFEFNPLVLAYYPQPYVFTYYDDQAQAHTYTPDFKVEWRVDIASETFEVKPAARLLEKKTRLKFALIANRFEAVGEPFKILTEAFLHAKPLASNLELLAANRGQMRWLPFLRLSVKESGLCGRTTLRELGRRLGSMETALQAVANCLVIVDLMSPITPDSGVTMSEVGQ